MLGGKGLHPIEGEQELERERLLAPEGAVVVERGMRWAGATKSGLPFAVTRVTKAEMVRQKNP
jgi:hypothetical protein